MRNGINVALRVSSAIYILSGFAALLTTGEHGAGYIVLAALVIVLAPVGEWLDGRFTAYRIVTTIAAVGYVLSLAYPFMQFGLLDAVTRLIIFILCYLMLHRKREHEYYQVFLMTFFLLLSASARFPDASIGLVMPVFLVSAVWAFLSLQIREESLRIGAGEVAEIEALPDAQGRRPVWRRAHATRALLVSVTSVSFISLLLAAGVFVATPRVGAGFISPGYISPAVSSSGLSDEIRLAAGGQIFANSRAVMTAQFPDEPGGRYADEENLYWRAAPMSFYSGGVWSVWEGDSRIGDERRKVRYSTQDVGVLERTAPGRGRPVKQVLFADDADPQVLPVLPVATRIEAPGRSVSWSARFDGSITAKDDARRSLRFVVTSEVEAPDPETLRRCRDNYADAISPRVLNLLTHSEVTAKTHDIVRQVTAGKTTVYDRAIAIRDYLQSNQFFYTTTPPSLPTERPVDTFINSTRIGHCELFASAMALMLRSQGIPTRVVRGYRGGEWNANDKTYTIRASMAHLWVEVYFMNYGWVMFDPSPVLEVDAAAPTTWNWVAKTASRMSMRSKMLWYQYVIGYNPRKLMLDFNTWGARTLAGASSGASEQGAAGTTQTSPAGSAMWLALEVLFGAVLCVVVWRSWRRRVSTRIALTADQRRAISLYRGLLKKARRLGVDCRGKTAEELGRSFLAWGWLGADEANLVIKVYNEARFGGKAFPAEEFTTRMRALGKLRLSVPK